LPVLNGLKSTLTTKRKRERVRRSSRSNRRSCDRWYPHPHHHRIMIVMIYIKPVFIAAANEKRREKGETGFGV